MTCTIGVVNDERSYNFYLQSSVTEKRLSSSSALFSTINNSIMVCNNKEILEYPQYVICKKLFSGKNDDFFLELRYCSLRKHFHSENFS